MKFASIALRNLTRQKRRSLLLAGAIAVGIFIVTLVNAFTAGTVQVIKENFADLIGGHVFVTVERKDGDRTVELITDETGLMKAVKALGVDESAIARTVEARGNFIFNGKTAVQIVIGADWSKDSDLKAKLAIPDDVFQRLVATPNGIVVSKKTAERLKANLGDSVVFKCESISGQVNVVDFVIGFVTDDNSEFGGMVTFASQDLVNRVVNLPDLKSYLTLRVKLPALEMAPAFALRLEEELAKDFKVKPKDTGMSMAMDANVFEVNRNSDFEGERVKVETINDMLSEITQLSAGLAVASLIMLVVLLLITMIGIANTFRMILYERIQEIGAMRALGMQRNGVKSIMLFEAVFLSLVGVALGVVLASVAMGILGLVNFRSDTFFDIFLNNGHLVFKFEAMSMLASTGLVVFFTWLAALGPSSKAAKLNPADALRTSY